MTRDKGQTGASPGSPSGVSAIGIDPGHPELMLVGGRRGISRSTDAGKTWKEVGAVRGRLLGFHFDQSSPIPSRTCFAATDQAFLRSDDGGASWHDVATGFGSAPILAFAGGSNKKTKTCVLYCSVENREVAGQITGGIYRSDDRGPTWTSTTVESADQADERCTNSSLTTDVNPSRVYTTRGQDSQVFRSDDRARPGVRSSSTT